MTKEEFIKLTEKISEGTASDEEIGVYNRWYNQYQREQSLNPAEIPDAGETEKMLYSRIRSEIGLKPRVRSLSTWITAAAIILIVFSAGLYFYRETDTPKTGYTKANTPNDIAPGSNKAILTLADGTKISLTDANDGELAEQAGITITKAANGQLLYTITDLESESAALAFNTIETPKGGQYQIILPDGTKVWLNAASSLRYPVSFASLSERAVNLNGEAYFEVAKDKSHPFLVITGTQEVEVLGTHFNVNAYTDEASAKTTLLEGSIKVSHPASRNSQLLQPGQQSVLSNKGISVNNADTEEAVAWKNGYFRFDDENLESIMRKVSRWYDVDVTWKDETVKFEPFAAVTTRFANVSVLLKMLEQTGDARFEVEGKRISISKKKK